MSSMNSATPLITANSPLVVGVSGHRDLREDWIPQIKEQVSGFLRDLHRRLPNTQLDVLVGMADGADLLVAQVAIELGLRVEAVLPMPLKQYAVDFDAATFRVLEELLRHPRVRCIELSNPTPHVAAHSSRAGRDSLYANLTATLVRRSSVLIAIWDGQPSPLAGGTADTVLRYVGVRTEENKYDDSITIIDSAAEIDAADQLVYWVPAARTAGALSPARREPCFLQGVGDNELVRHEGFPHHLEQQLEELDRYNLEYQQMTNDGSLGAPDSLAASLPRDVPLNDRATLEDIDAQYGKADSLAVYYQMRSDRLFGLFGIMTFTMGLAYLIYEKVTESRIVLLAYFIILLSSLGLYYLLQGKRWFAKHLTYRALAETMRAMFYLRLAGVDQRVDAGEVLSLSGIDRFHGFSWISYILKSVEATEIHSAGRADYHSVQSRIVEEAWIESQYRYFTAKVQKLSTSSKRVKNLRNALFCVILLVITALFLFGDLLHHMYLWSGMPVKNLLTFSMGFLAVLLGVWELHQDKMATQELLWQYRNQLNHFSKAKLQLARINSPSRRDDIFVALGKDSLMESYLWTIHRYHREHEPPAAH
jgi:hypothetical protein